MALCILALVLQMSVWSQLASRECSAGKLSMVFICCSKHTCTHAWTQIHMHTQMHAYTRTHMHYWSWRAKILRKYSKGVAILKQAGAVSLRDQWWMINLCSFPQAFLSHESEFSFLKEHFSIPSHMAFSFDFIRQKRLTFCCFLERADSDLIKLTGAIMTGVRGYWSE